MFRRKTQQTPPETTPKPVQRPRVSAPTNFPSGLAISTEKGVYFIKGKTRFKFFSDRVFKTWDLTPVFADFSSIKHLKFGGTLGFRDGTLINNLADGKMYLVSETKRRHITSPDAFDRYGLNKDRMVVVSDEEANFHEDGEILN